MSLFLSNSLEFSSCFLSDVAAHSLSIPKYKINFVGFLDI